MCGATAVVYPGIQYAESGVVQQLLHYAAAAWPPTDCWRKSQRRLSDYCYRVKKSVVGRLQG